jgi:hypothetical protein
MDVLIKTSRRRDRREQHTTAMADMLLLVTTYTQRSLTLFIVLAVRICRDFGRLEDRLHHVVWVMDRLHETYTSTPTVFTLAAIKTNI